MASGFEIFLENSKEITEKKLIQRKLDAEKILDRFKEKYIVLKEKPTDDFICKIEIPVNTNIFDAIDIIKNFLFIEEKWPENKVKFKETNYNYYASYYYKLEITFQLR